MSSSLKRVSLLITNQQHEYISSKNLNLSGLVRDLLDDYFSDHKITVSVCEETKNIYDKIVSNTGSDDSEVETHLKRALRALLNEKINEMKDLEKSLK